MKKAALVFILTSITALGADKGKMMINVPQSKIVSYIALTILSVIILYLLISRLTKLAKIMKQLKQNMISKEKDFVEKVEFLLDFDKKKVSAFGARSSGKTNYWATFTHKQRYELDDGRYLNVVFDKKGIQNETRLYLNSLYEILANGGIIPRTEDKDKRVIQLDLTLKDERYDKPIQQMFDSFDYPGESLAFIDDFTKFLNGQISESELDHNQKNHFNTLKELIENIRNSTGVILIVDPNPDEEEEKAQSMLSSIVFSEIKKIEADKKIKVPVVVLISKADTLKEFGGKLGENFEQDRLKAVKYLREYHENFYHNFSDNDMNIFPVSSLGNEAELKPITDFNGNPLKGHDGKSLMGYFPFLNKSKGIVSIYLDKPVEYILEKRNTLWKERVIDIFNDPRIKYSVAKKIYAKFKSIVDFKDDTFEEVTRKFKEVRGKNRLKNGAFVFLVAFLIAGGYLLSGVFLFAKFQQFLSDSDRFKGKDNYYAEKLEFFKKNTPNLWYIKYYRLFIKFDIEQKTRELYETIFTNPSIDEMTKTMYLEDFMTVYAKDAKKYYYKQKLYMLEDIYSKDISSDFYSAADKIKKYKAKEFILKDKDYTKVLETISEEITLLNNIKSPNKTMLLYKSYLNIGVKVFNPIFDEEIKKYYDEISHKIENNDNYLKNIKKLRNDFREFARGYLTKELKELDTIIAARECEESFKELKNSYIKVNPNMEYIEIDSFTTKCDDFKITYPDSRYLPDVADMKAKAREIQEDTMFKKIISLDDAKRFLNKFPRTKRVEMTFRKFQDQKENIEIKAYYLSLVNGAADIDTKNTETIKQEIKGFDDSQLMVKRLKNSNVLSSDNAEALAQELESFNGLSFSSVLIKETKEIIRRSLKLLDIKKAGKFEDKLDLLLEYDQEAYKFTDPDYIKVYEENKTKARTILTEAIKNRIKTIEIDKNLSDADLDSIKEFFRLKSVNKDFFNQYEDVKNKENEITALFDALAEKYINVKGAFAIFKGQGVDKLVKYSVEYEALYNKVVKIANDKDLPVKLRNILLAVIDNKHYDNILKEIKSLNEDSFSYISDAIDKYNRTLTGESLTEIGKKIEDYEKTFGATDKSKSYKERIGDIENGVEVTVTFDTIGKNELNKIGIEEITAKKVIVDSTEYTFINTEKMKCKVKPGSKLQMYVKYTSKKFMGMFGNEKTAYSKVFDVYDNGFDFSVLKDNKEYDVIGTIAVDKTPLKISK